MANGYIAATSPLRGKVLHSEALRGDDLRCERRRAGRPIGKRLHTLPVQGERGPAPVARLTLARATARDRPGAGETDIACTHDGAHLDRRHRTPDAPAPSLRAANIVIYLSRAVAH